MVANGIDETEFTLEIFDRTGTVVFSTTSAGQSWDGTYLGTYAPAADYTVSIEASDTTGHDFAFRHVITMIR